MKITPSIIGLLLLTGCAQAQSESALPLPDIVIHVEAPTESMDTYTIEYGCQQLTATGLLLPKLQTATANVLKEVGRNWAVFETKRGLCRQTRLMQKQVSPRMDSKHLIGAAVDFICWNGQGKASWDCNWEVLGKACRRQGLIWGGDFKTNDPGHCELPPLQPL